MTTRANTDEDGFANKMTYTPGNAHDSQEIDKLRVKAHGPVYATGYKFTVIPAQ
ncbi:hypothetical protein [Candidatus Spongiihabitans sp.]|uniref:hypothetical protein n=1 Tax=Candidatus Spongiihabitans sp. TaxID=3101308 RepID=UPI003C7BAC85